MYKKIILSFLLVFSLVSCTAGNNDSAVANAEYVKSVWFSYYELSELTENNDEAEFKKAVTTAFKELKSNGFNRVTVQVRPFADAFYRSDIFPSSAYCFKTQGAEMPYDPLEIMVEAAHKQDLTIEAWVNPYRVSSSTGFSNLSQDNIALEFKDTENLIVCDSGIYFNPGSDEVKKLIVDGIKEIVENYAVDSVCFDDYFYPTTDETIDADMYKEYKENGGESTLDDWRRENVSDLVSSVYKAVKEISSEVTFGISPASNMDNDYSNLYADVEKWMTNEGYVDYICPQIYFGFQNESQPFMSTVKEWAETAVCDLYVALPLYKAGLQDEFAGDRGIEEFVDNNNIIARQVIYLSKIEETDGFYIFSYSSLKDNEETANLYSAMQQLSR